MNKNLNKKIKTENNNVQNLDNLSDIIDKLDATFLFIGVLKWLNLLSDLCSLILTSKQINMGIKSLQTRCAMKEHIMTCIFPFGFANKIIKKYSVNPLSFIFGNSLLLNQVESMGKCYQFPAQILVVDRLNSLFYFDNLIEKNIDGSSNTEKISKFEIIDFSFLDYFNSILFMKIWSQFPELFGQNLKYLSFENCSSVTDNIILKTTAKSPNLTFLNLSNCENITEKGYQSLVENCPNLKFFNISNCLHFTENNLLNIIQNLPNLASLDLSDCLSLKDEALIDIANNCPNLRYLNLSGFLKLTNNLLFIPKKCQNLKRIDIDTISFNLLNSLVETLKEHNPQYDINHLKIMINFYNSSFCFGSDDENMEDG